MNTNLFYLGLDLIFERWKSRGSINDTKFEPAFELRMKLLPARVFVSKVQKKKDYTDWVSHRRFTHVIFSCASARDAFEFGRPSLYGDVRHVPDRSGMVVETPYNLIAVREEWYGVHPPYWFSMILATRGTIGTKVHNASAIWVNGPFGFDPLQLEL